MLVMVFPASILGPIVETRRRVKGLLSDPLLFVHRCPVSVTLVIGNRTYTCHMTSQR